MKLADHREFEAIPLCKGCDAGHQEGQGCIKDPSRGCWLESRENASKIKQLFIKSLGVLNGIEGIVHLIVSSIGLWGCFAIKVFDIRVMTPIIENFIFGFFSILTGIVMLNVNKKRQNKII